MSSMSSASSSSSSAGAFYGQVIICIWKLSSDNCRISFRKSSSMSSGNSSGSRDSSSSSSATAAAAGAIYGQVIKPPLASGTGASPTLDPTLHLSHLLFPKPPSLSLPLLFVPLLSLSHACARSIVPLTRLLSVLPTSPMGVSMPPCPLSMPQDLMPRDLPNGCGNNHWSPKKTFVVGTLFHFRK